MFGFIVRLKKKPSSSVLWPNVWFYWLHFWTKWFWPGSPWGYLLVISFETCTVVRGYQTTLPVLFFPSTLHLHAPQPLRVNVFPTSHQFWSRKQWLGFNFFFHYNPDIKLKYSLTIDTHTSLIIINKQKKNSSVEGSPSCNAHALIFWAFSKFPFIWNPSLHCHSGCVCFKYFLQIIHTYIFLDKLFIFQSFCCCHLAALQM